jgi:hypothetical protein
LKQRVNIDIYELFKAAHGCKDLCNKDFKNAYLLQNQIISNPKEERYNDEAEQEDQLLPTNNIQFNFLIDQLMNWLFFNLKKSSVFTKKKSNRFSNLHFKYLCFNYLFIKLFNIFNIFFLIFVINNLLGINLFNFFAKLFFDLVNNFKNKLFTSNESTILTATIDASSSNENILQSFYLMNSLFPLRSMCSFKIRELTQTNAYAVMCSLPINLFNQYIFFLLLIWFIIISIINVYYLIYWLWSLRKLSELEYVNKMLVDGLLAINYFDKSKYFDKLHVLHINKFETLLQFNDDNQTCFECESNLEEFYKKYLCSDFIFLLKIISINSSKKLVQQVVVYIWMIYLNNKQN